MTPAKAASVRFVNSWASVDLDCLRAVAALLVLFEHGRNLFFVDYPQLKSHPLWVTVAYGLSHSGHQAVVLFFVLSGYFIGGTVFRALEQRDWQWSGYLLRRLVRLWVVLLPTLLLCLGWDRLGIHLGRAPALYTGRVPDHVLGNVAALLAPHIFWANLFFVQGIVTPTFGSNGSLWSLAFEFWYYLLFPLGLLTVWRGVPWLQRVMYAATLFAAAWFVRVYILPAFPIWLAGAALYKLRAPTLSARTGQLLRYTSTMLYFALFFALGWYHGSTLLSDYFLTLITVPYLWLLLSHREPFRKKQIGVQAAREGARFSYTLYAAHMPFLVLLASLTVADTRWYPSARTLLYGSGLMLAALGYSYALAWLTEFRTDDLRRWLEELFGMTVKPPVLTSNPLQDDTVRTA